MKYTQDEIDALKKQGCLEYLLSRGHKPRSSQGKTYKFMCPWRKEREGSLHIYKSSNTWTDFSDRSGGSIIQLVMKFEDVSFGKACEILSGGKLPERVYEEREPEEPPIKIISIGPITSAWIKQYLAKRCIPVSVADKFTKQVRLELKGKDGTPYRKTCVGFLNNRGGYEFRSAKCKLSNSPKMYTSINRPRPEVIVVEGFMNLLTLITIYGYDPNYEYISLNSASMSAYIDWSSYDNVLYYGDWDASGLRVLEEIGNKTSVVDKRDLYIGFNDINKWWVEKKSQQNTLYKNELKGLL